MEDLLVFPPSVNLHRHPLKLEGVFMFQDKASCFPVLALDPQPGWDVIDACAGNSPPTQIIYAIRIYCRCYFHSV